MKKRLCRLLSCVLLCAVLTGGLATPASAVFTDVPAGHWAADEIARCAELGIFGGTSASTFGLGQSMTRASVARVLCRFFGWDSGTPYRRIYRDVPANASYAGALQAAYDHGVFTLQQADFRPQDAITREELAVALIRALGYGSIAGLAQDLDHPFTDVTTNVGYIVMAYDLGLIGGTSATTFSPKKTASREQVAVILMRLHDKLYSAAPEKIGIFSPTGSIPAMTGYSAVAVSGTRIGSDGVHISETAAKNAATVLPAIRRSGAVALLHTGGIYFATKADPAVAAGQLTDALNRTGYDGILLDITEVDSSHSANMAALVQALDAALGEKLLYIITDPPARKDSQSPGAYDLTALAAAAADRLVLRITPHEATVGGTTAAPLEPLEEVYFSLRTLCRSLDGDKLSVLLTTTASVWDQSKQTGSLSAVELSALLKQKDTSRHYSARYACAYLTSGTATVWYLDRQAAAARTQLARFFGTGLCLSDLTSVSADLSAGLK